MAENKYITHYYHCGNSWTDVWSCICNDRCPVCGAEITPFDSDEIIPKKVPKALLRDEKE